MASIDTLVVRCVNNGYVTEEKAPWLQYALERRITSLIAFIPLTVIGLFITNPATLFTFYFTFCSLRARTNGVHAKTFGGCLFCSILGELFFLGIAPKFLTAEIAVIALSISMILICLLAPYNHPNMNLSDAEISACSKSAKIRLGILVIILSGSRILHREWLSDGILLGIVMTALTLVLAYCPKISICGETE